MSSVFLWVSHPQGCEPFQGEALIEALGAWVPFRPERVERLSHPSGLASALIWQTHAEAARGSYVAQTPDHAVQLSYTGWWREPDAAPQDRPVSGVMLAALCGERRCPRARQGYERGLADFGPPAWAGDAPIGPLNIEALEMLHLSPGQHSTALADAQGRVHALRSALGGGALFYSTVGRDARDQPISLISNRASLISAYLNRGSPAPPRPESLAWLLARHEQPLGLDQEPWAEVKALGSGQRILAQAGVLSLETIALPQAQRAEWSALFEGLCWRAEELKRLPEVPYALALTGGYDSRLILGALIATDQLKRVSHYYVNAAPGHADTLSAQRIADHYQLELHVAPPGRWQDHDEPLLTKMRRHNLFVEHLFSAWDLLGGPVDLTFAPRGLLPGHLGELYRSHYHWLMSKSRALITRGYASAAYADRHGLLNREMMRRCGAVSRAWVQARYREGVKTDFIFDELHRRARQEGWATRAIQVESFGFPSLCLLPCVSARAHYESLPLSARRQPEVHFELTRRVDDELWRLPFAGKSWPATLTARRHEAPTPGLSGQGDVAGYQVRAWRAQGVALSAWLLDSPPSSALWDVIDRDKLKRRLKVLEQSLTPRSVKGILATCAIKLALTEPLTPAQLHR